MQSPVLYRPPPSARLLWFLRSHSQSQACAGPRRGPGRFRLEGSSVAAARTAATRPFSRCLAFLSRPARLQSCFAPSSRRPLSTPRRATDDTDDGDGDGDDAPNPPKRAIPLLYSHGPRFDPEFPSALRGFLDTQPGTPEPYRYPDLEDSSQPDPAAADDNDDEPTRRPYLEPKRSLAAKAAQEPRLRCTELDEKGDVKLRDGQFKKTELIAKYGLLPRDLRKIDSSKLPHIFVRPSAILINLLHLKVLIRHDRVLLFDLYGSRSSTEQSTFVEDLQGKLKLRNGSAGSAGGLPYELTALEAVLTSVTAALETEWEDVKTPSVRVLQELEDSVDRQNLRVLLILSKRLSTFEQRAKLVRDALDELLEANDDLAAMYLTEKANNIVRREDDHTEAELMLESYHKLIDEIAQDASNLVSNIRNTEEIIRAILDANRNSLMVLDLQFSVGTIALATGTFIAGLYGMNLTNSWENWQPGFYAVTGASAVLSAIVCTYGLLRLRRVQRVKMQASEGSAVAHACRGDRLLMLEQRSRPDRPKAWRGRGWLRYG